MVARGNLLVLWPASFIRALSFSIPINKMDKQEGGDQEEGRKAPIPTSPSLTNYAEGDVGKFQALSDLQAMFDELHEQRVISEPFDVLRSPYEGAPAAGGSKALTVAQMLTPRFRRKKLQQQQAQLPQEIRSEGTLPQEQRRKVGSMGGMKSESAPTLTPRARARARAPSPTPKEVRREAKAFKAVQHDILLEEEEEAEEEKEGDAIESSKPEVELWKVDVARITKLKSFSKISPPSDTLILKYKEPIWPHQLPLHRILSCSGLQLVHLVLDGSDLGNGGCGCGGSLRSLGSSLPTLTTLSVSRTRLRSLDGAFAFPHLRTLLAVGNELRTAVHAGGLPSLTHLDLSSNPLLQDLPSFTALRACRALSSLKLYSTGVSEEEDFWGRISAYLPHLKEIHPYRGGSGKGLGLKIPGGLREISKSWAEEAEVIFKRDEDGGGGDMGRDKSSAEEENFELLLQQSVEILSDDGSSTTTTTLVSSSEEEEEAYYTGEE